MQHINILSLSQSLEFIKTPFANSPSPKQFEKHLALFSQLQVSQHQNLNLSNLIIPELTKRYYQLSTSKTQIFKQEYILIKFLQLISSVARNVLQPDKSPKDLIVVLMSATVTLTKRYFQRVELAFIDLQVLLLEFNCYLLETIAERADFKVEEIYPKQYSLCSFILRQPALSLKNFSLCIKSIKILVQQNKQVVNYGQGTRFLVECAKRLMQDLKYLQNTYYKLQVAFQQKIAHLAQTLLSLTLNVLPITPKWQLQATNEDQLSQKISNDLFSHNILLSQICKIPLQLHKFDKYRQTLIAQSYKHLLLQTCDHLTHAQADLQLKKREISKLRYLIAYIDLSQDETVASKIAQLLLFTFSIRQNHQLITIPHHSTTIPLQPIHAQHNSESYPIKGLEKEYKSQLYRMLVEIIPFLELEPCLLDLLQQLFHQLSQNNLQLLLQHFSDQLLKQQYHLTMSLTKLYTHLQTLFVLRFLLNSQKIISSAAALSTIFLTLSCKVQTLLSLQASYMEQQLLIAVTLQIVFRCYMQLKRFYQTQGGIQARIKFTQNSIFVVEKILNQLSQDSYLIRLITTHTLLQYSGKMDVKNALNPLQATLILRNKNNLPLMVNLLQIAELNSTDLEELAEFYMQYRGAQSVLRLLLPKIRVQNARRCILTVQRWWLLLSREVIQYLNCKQMAHNQNQLNFPMHDGENVSIRNALGVIIIELEQKWVFELKSQRRQAIVDILINLLQVNPQMVIFRSKFSQIIARLTQILQQTLGLTRVQVQSKKQRSKSLVKGQQVLEPQKIEFYNRLRLKIYKLFKLMPEDCFAVDSKQNLQPLKQLLNNEFECIKKGYLFEGNSQLKQSYDILKAITSKLQSS